MPMDAVSRKTRGQVAKRWLVRLGIAWMVVWLLYASPIFIVSMAIRIAVYEPMPASVSRTFGPWGDGYLVNDGSADGFITLYDAFGREVCSPYGGHDDEGDGRCPEVDSNRWLTIPVWSMDWVD